MQHHNKTIVVKFGTSTLTQGSPKLNLAYMMEIVRQLAQLHQAGFPLGYRHLRRYCGGASY